MRITTFFISLMFSLMSHAAQITEDFSGLGKKDVETGIWNLQLGKLTPHLMIMNYGNGSQSDDFSVGDGSDGVFDITTYQKFSVGGDLSGNIIRLDQTKYPKLNVTRFHLAAGWFLEPANNLPLQIYSQGDVSIDGEIWCHGRNGSSGATGGAAGAGRCGGGHGGAGGASGAAGGNGDDIAGGPSGGNGGGAGSGGGGGGGYDAQFAPPSAGAGGGGGAAGTNHIDHAFSAILGAAAGGGGGGSGGQFGGGGGGGAGTVVIHAVRDVTFGASGKIRVYGGAGGAGVGASGSGGSGGSGSVQIFAGRDLVETSVAQVESDAAQTTATAGGAAAGGAGGFGRSWMASGQGFAFDYTPQEDLSHSPGAIEFFVGTDTFETKSFEVRNTDPNYLSVTSSPSDPGITFLIKASNDNFVSDDTGWVAVTDPSLSDRRFFKLQISLTNASPSVPLTVDSMTIEYDGHTQNEFNFTGAGCGRIAGSSGGTGLWLLLPFLLLLQVRRTFWLRLASIVLVVAPVHAGLPVCDESIVKKQCDEMKASSKKYFEFANNTRIPNPFRNKELKDEERYRQAPINIRSQKARVARIFDEAKESILQSILRGRDRRALSVEEKSMVARVELVALRHGDHEDVENDFECAGNAVNAGYMPDEAAIHVCRGLYEYPDVTLYHVLGHEIGHSIDSCNLTKTFVQDAKNSGPYSRQVVSPRKIPANSRVIADAVPDERLPYREVRECLVRQNGFQILDSPERNEFIDRIANERLQLNQEKGEVAFAKRRTDVVNEMAGVDCPYNSMNKISHMPEVIADMYGAIAVDRYLQGHPEQVQEEKVSTFYNWRYLCKDASLSQSERDQETPRWGHPLTIDRYMKIVLQVPAIARGLGCEVNPKYSCFRDALTTPLPGATSVPAEAPLKSPGASQ